MEPKITTTIAHYLMSIFMFLLTIRSLFRMDNIKEHFADSKNLWQNNYVGEAVEKVESVNGTTTRTCFLCNALVGSFGVKEFVFRVFWFEF